MASGLISESSRVRMGWTSWPRNSPPMLRALSIAASSVDFPDLGGPYRRVSRPMAIMPGTYHWVGGKCR